MLFGFHLVENVKELFRNPQQLFCVGFDCQSFGELNEFIAVCGHVTSSWRMTQENAKSFRSSEQEISQVFTVGKATPGL